MRSGVFVVEDMESRQTDVRDFFLTESNCGCGVLRRHSACRTNGCRGWATTRERQRPSDPQYRYGFCPTPSFRSLLRVRHRRDLSYKLGWPWLRAKQILANQALPKLPFKGTLVDNANLEIGFRKRGGRASLFEVGTLGIDGLFTLMARAKCLLGRTRDTLPLSRMWAARR